MQKRVVQLMVLVALVLLTSASAAFAEGYNRGGFIGDEGWGGLVDDSRFNYMASTSALWPGPHGGYNTTTNKCQDCHSTHYAAGSYKLLRANQREAACDFCHGGGGGSNVNIMMDNAYTKTAADMAVTWGPAADATTTSGFGTGHTLGYQGRAPTDIQPAYTQPAGFSCFDCHTPHGNSARALTTFWDPGKRIQPTLLNKVVHLKWDIYSADATLSPIETYVQDLVGPQQALIEDIDLTPLDILNDTGPDDGWRMAWGIERATGNIVVKYDFSFLGIGDGPVVYRKPIFPTARFLLLKNPDSADATDTITATTEIGGKQVVTDGSNKIQIDWDNPLGPGTTYPLGPWAGNLPTYYDNTWDMIDQSGYTGGLPLFYTGNDERFPFPLFITGDDSEGRPGIATLGEFCTDCHDGAAGLNKQAAEVWNSTEDTYTIAYSHDSQPRSCDRQLYLNSEDDDNFGPDCRSCHQGGAGCSQCHADPGLYPVDTPIEPAWDTAGTPPLTIGTTTYQAQPSFNNFGTALYSTALDRACIDGGFTFPHRTLAVNMLKDNLYGVDFDGTPLAPGEVRGAGMVPDDLPGGPAPLGSFMTEQLVNVETHNLDSACIDCHNPNIWNGDDPSYAASFTAENWFYTGFNYRTDTSVPAWDVKGWDLLLKGLP